MDQEGRIRTRRKTTPVCVISRHRLPRLAPAALRWLNRVRVIMQEHLGLASGEVSLRDAALVQWAAALVVSRAARLGACGTAAVALQTGYITGLGKDARVAAPSAERNPYSIGIDGSGS